MALLLALITIKQKKIPTVKRVFEVLRRFSNIGKRALHKICSCVHLYYVSSLRAICFKLTTNCLKLRQVESLPRKSNG